VLAVTGRDFQWLRNPSGLLLRPLETGDQRRGGGPLWSFYEAWRAEHGGLSDGEVDDLVRLARSPGPLREGFGWEA
jgi:hypothetical protein